MTLSAQAKNLLSCYWFPIFFMKTHQVGSDGTREQVSCILQALYWPQQVKAILHQFGLIFIFSSRNFFVDYSIYVRSAVRSIYSTKLISHNHHKEAFFLPAISMDTANPQEGNSLRLLGLKFAVNKEKKRGGCKNNIK